MNPLLEKYVRNTLSRSEREQLFSEAAQDPLLKKELQSLLQASSYKAMSPRDTDRTEAEPYLTLFHSIKEDRTPKNRRMHVFRNNSDLFKYAAAILITAACTLLLQHSYDVWKTHDTYAESKELSIDFMMPAGQHGIVMLPDGSKVWLNTNSSLKYPASFTSKDRFVELEGEAYFEIAPDSLSPFIVSTYKAEIKVLGTRFNVYSYRNAPEFFTSLVEGSVELSPVGKPENAVLMKPGEAVRITEESLEIYAFENSDFLLWTEGVYAFDNMRLEDIFERLAMYTGTRIELHNSTIANYPVTAKFRQKESLKNMIKSLQRIHPFQMKIAEDESLISIY